MAVSLQNCLDALIGDGWRIGDVQVVRNACLRMLSVIYDVSGMETAEEG